MSGLRATRRGRCARSPGGSGGWRQRSPRPFAPSRSLADECSLSGRGPAHQRPSGGRGTLLLVRSATAEIPGATLPLAALAELVRRLEAGDPVDPALAELRAAWPGLGAADRGLLGGLVTGLLEEGPRPPAGAPREPLEGALARLGVRRLRPGQDRAIAAALAGRDALVVMATGSGKSLCYQAPAAALSGLTVVVSPLIALMADQL